MTHHCVIGDNTLLLTFQLDDLEGPPDDVLVVNNNDYLILKCGIFVGLIFSGRLDFRGLIFADNQVLGIKISRSANLQ